MHFSLEYAFAFIWHELLDDNRPTCISTFVIFTTILTHEYISLRITILIDNLSVFGNRRWSEIVANPSCVKKAIFSCCTLLSPSHWRSLRIGEHGFIYLPSKAYKATAVYNAMVEAVGGYYTSALSPDLFSYALHALRDRVFGRQLPLHFSLVYWQT